MSEFAHLPPAGTDDWEPCPRCYNMDGGCPFCGHGYVPKSGFGWPDATVTAGGSALDVLHEAFPEEHHDRCNSRRGETCDCYARRTAPQRAALYAVEQLVAAARVRRDNDHNETCDTQLSPGSGYDCTCGHDELDAALARFDRNQQA